MEVNETAAVFVAFACGLAVVVLIVAIVSLTKTMRLLRETIAEVRSETLPVVADMRTVVGNANAELERVDNLLGTAESVSATVDSASRLAYLTFSNPVIKGLAFASGTGRAARRFRKRRAGA